MDTSTLGDPDPKLTMRTTDGTQLTYKLKGSDYQCTEIKDRNGNFITINYVSGRIDTVVDTLARNIKFNYDVNGWLTLITQAWAGEPLHPWATFAYTNKTIQTNFTNLTVLGPANGSTPKVLSSVTLTDNSHYDFAYTTRGQIWKVSNFATDNHLLNYRSYNLAGADPSDNSPQDDCPRFTERHDWAENWNRSGALGPAQLPNGPEQEVVTTYAVPVSDSWTMPDGSAQSGTVAQVGVKLNPTTYVSYDKIYFIGTQGTSSGWQRGLRALDNTYDGSNTLQRQAMTTWTQDNTSVSYPLNPRVTESNIYDPVGNRARTRMTYQSAAFGDGTNCQLPQDVYEYQANATTVLRRSHTDYNLAATYTNRRIIGLPSEKTLYEGPAGSETLMSRVGVQYDESGSIDGTDAPVQHDNANYTASFVVGRGNVSSVIRYDVTNGAQSTTSSNKYNTAGAVVQTTDPSTHHVSISYSDSFSDGNNSRNTLAYPTTVTDPDNYSVSSKYNYDFAAITWKQSPLPNTTQNLGPEQTFAYDSVGRLQRITNIFNNAYTRYQYGPNYIETFSTVNTVADEGHSLRVFDGAGRLIATAKNHPNSIGGFSGTLTIYDVMGRVFKQSNPTETSVSIPGMPAPIYPYSWAPVGDDDPGAGTGGLSWLYTQQTYDWKGRPLVTTNTDLTTKQASYAGCGCAGGQVVTLTDEGTVDPVDHTPKKRQQKIYSDVLGRTVKTEMLNWENASPYSTSVTSYNARDQVTLVRQFQGTAPADSNDLSCPSGTCLQTTMGYDGFGRLQSKHVPEQDAGTTTTYNYDPDDTVQSVTDARGARATFGHNGRHLVTGVIYSAPAGITVPTAVGYGYDAAGNRLWMTDDVGRVDYGYDQLSRLSVETRQFFDSIPQAPLANNGFRISYDYNLSGQLKTITAPYGEQINYNRDGIGRLTGVTGPSQVSAAGPLTYVSNIRYRAWGDIKGADYNDSFNQGCYDTTMSVIETYDARLRHASYELKQNPGNQYCTSGTILKKQYQYYDDSLLSNVKDLSSNGILDRSQEYDSVARLTHVKTGSEAQGLGGLGFYRQNFSYDAWGQQITRQMTTPQSDEIQTNSYLNGRATSWVNGQPTSWQYDADGRVTNDTHTSYSYYADGDVHGIQVPNDYVLTRGTDGDGFLAKETVSGTSPTERKYFVRSTVLGGEIMTQVSPDAWEYVPQTLVYAFGKLLARVDKHYLNGQNHWFSYLQFYDPSETTHFDSDGGDYSNRRLELDPAKAVVLDTFNPNPPAPTGGFFDSWTLGLEGFGGNPFGGYGCYMDGFQTNCATVMRSLALGTADECPDITCGPAVAVMRREDGTTHKVLVPLSHDADTGLLGYFPKQWSSLHGAGKDSGIDHKEVVKAYRDCIKELYGEFYEMVSFKPTTGPKGTGGNKDDDKYNGITRIRDLRSGAEANLVNDPTPPPSFYKKIEGTDTRGGTFFDDPWWTFTVSQGATLSAMRPAEKRYPDLYLARGMDYIRTQFHETGAALSMIRSRYYPRPYAPLPDNGLYKGGHEDDGPAMEDCVGRHYYAAKGLTPGH
jgi:YD repeat-containing protein